MFFQLLCAAVPACPLTSSNYQLCKQSQTHALSKDGKSSFKNEMRICKLRRRRHMRPIALIKGRSIPFIKASHIGYCSQEGKVEKDELSRKQFQDRAGKAQKTADGSQFSAKISQACGFLSLNWLYYTQQSSHIYQKFGMLSTGLSLQKVSTIILSTFSMIHFIKQSASYLLCTLLDSRVWQYHYNYICSKFLE